MPLWPGHHLVQAQHGMGQAVPLPQAQQAGEQVRGGTTQICKPGEVSRSSVTLCLSFSLKKNNRGKQIKIHFC